jgi:putative ABC transport system permease protein
MRTIISVFNSIKRAPLKSILTFVTVGIGVGVLIFALGMSSTFSDIMESQLESQGVVVNYANAGISTDGEIEVLRPPQSDGSITDIITYEVSGVEAISPVAPVNWTEFVAGGETFQVRSVLGVNEQYVDVFGLDLVAGILFSADDVEQGAKKAVISESLAEVLFGSAFDAVGQTLNPPSSTNPQEGGARRFSPPTYEIAGVVADPSELQRQSYGIADMIVPYTSVIPAGMNLEQASGLFAAQGVVLAKGVTSETVQSQLNEVLVRNYGDDFALETWEGGPGGATGYLGEMRRTVDTFSIVINLLGFILLAAASIGILSIMLVEALGRSREIAVERALGASKMSVLREFATRSVLVSAISAAIGIGLTFVLAGPLTDIVLPIFSGISVKEVGSVISPQSVLIGAASALLIGGIFGVLPVFAVLQPGIADSIREG